MRIRGGALFVLSCLVWCFASSPFFSRFADCWLLLFIFFSFSSCCAGAATSYFCSLLLLLLPLAVAAAMIVAVVQKSGGGGDSSVCVCLSVFFFLVWSERWMLPPVIFSVSLHGSGSSPWCAACIVVEFLLRLIGYTILALRTV